MSTNMPSQLTSLLQNQALINYTRKFSDMFIMLPQDLSTLFSNCLASTLSMVQATLPPVLTSPIPENLAISPVFSFQFIQFSNLLTLLLGTIITTVKLFVIPNNVSKLVSKLLTIMNTGLYGNQSLDLPALLNSLYSTLAVARYGASQPYSALTNFPFELFSMLNNTQSSDLHPLPSELQKHPHSLVVTMNIALDNALRNLRGTHERLQHQLNSNNAAPNYHLERLTVPYVYQAREDADTDPDKCSVCFEEMKNGDHARRLCCLHHFHLQCIDRWLKTHRRCPLCRTPIKATYE